MRGLHSGKCAAVGKISSIPAYLCPALSSFDPKTPRRSSQHPLGKIIRQVTPRLGVHTAAEDSRLPSAVKKSSLLVALPLSCPGCGAFTQDALSHEAGFYSAGRKAVKSFIQAQGRGAEQVHTQGYQHDPVEGGGNTAGEVRTEVAQVEPSRFPFHTMS